MRGGGEENDADRGEKSKSRHFDVPFISALRSSSSERQIRAAFRVDLCGGLGIGTIAHSNALYIIHAFTGDALEIL
jgi:hypothetical protein